MTREELEKDYYADKKIPKEEMPTRWSEHYKSFIVNVNLILSELTKKDNAIKKLIADMARLEEELTEKDKQIEELQERLCNVQMQKAGEKSSLVSHLVEANEDYKKQIEELKKHHKNVCEQLTQTHRNIGEENKRLKAQYEELCNMSNKRYQEAQDYNDKLEKENLDSKVKIAELQHRLDSLQGYLDHDIEYDIEQKNAELEAQIEKMKCCGNCANLCECGICGYEECKKYDKWELKE